jgi:nicotinate-nucleotide adenylyltransferase
MSTRLGVLGGTFDPIHVGHLDLGDAAQRALGLDELRVVPLREPPHRPSEPRASAFHRFALAALAIQDRPAWRLSDIELLRQGPSYTFDTLKAIQGEGWRPLQIFFILGADAFAEIAAWYQFPAVLDEANFVVVARPGTTLDGAVARTPQLIPRMHTTAVPRESTNETAIFLVEAATRDVSSSAVRARLSAGLPVEEYVPPAVARYVTAHRLYGAAVDFHGEEQRTHQ